MSFLDDGEDEEGKQATSMPQDNGEGFDRGRCGCGRGAL
jgi:hypothetical protein